MSKKDRLVTLLGNELIIREDIQIGELHKLYPEVITPITPNCYTVQKNYKIDGLNHIILLYDYVDSITNKKKKARASLEGYYCPIFVSFEEDMEKVADHVWMRITNEDGRYWLRNIFKFSDVYSYINPNVWNIPEEFKYIEYFSYKDSVVKELLQPYKTEVSLGLPNFIPVTIF